MLEGYFKRSKRRSKPEIGMAPLIDMIFILLIFFLVTTTFTQETGVTVERPKAATAEILPSESIRVGVTDRGAIFFENREVDLRDLHGHLEQRLLDSRTKTVIILADTRSRTGRVIEVVDTCKKAGAEKVSISSLVEE